MEQMNVYRDNSFKRYEHLPMHHRLLYWTDYLQRLVEFSLSNPDSLTGEQHTRLLAEIRQVTAIIKILQHEPNNRTVKSKTVAKSAKQKPVMATTDSK